MQVDISLKRAVQSMIVFFMIVAIALVWPLKLIRPWQSIGETDPLSDRLVQNEGTLMQEFVPELYELTYISFYIYNEDLTGMEEGRLVFRLFDEKMNKLEERSFLLEELSVPGDCRIRIGSELEVGKKYYFTIENPGAELVFSITDEGSPDVRYEYKALFTKLQYLLIAAIVLLAGGALVFLAGWLLRKAEVTVRLDFGFRLGVGILAAGASLWAAWNVFPLKKFTSNPLDILFYETGIFLFLGFSLYGLLFRRKEQPGVLIRRRDVLDRLPVILSSVAFAGVVLGGVRYLNALNMYQQKLGVNIALASFAAAVIFGYKKKDLFHWSTPVYAVLAACYYVWVCIQNGGQSENSIIIRGMARYGILWGFIALNTLRALFQKGRKRVSLIYTAALILLIAEMVRSRNERQWPVDVLALGGIFALQVIYKEKDSQYLREFSNGVFLHFIGVSIYALLYRPFYYFRYTRYPGIFHTVTITAVYLVFVLVLALIRLLSRYREKRCIKEIWKEIWIVGLAAAFLLLTASRTGLLAAFILCPVIYVFISVTEFKDGFFAGIKRFLLFICITVCFFPMVFAACRIVPAVVGKPFVYEIELFEDTILPGEEWDSRKYITVERYLEIAVNRVSAKKAASVQDETGGGQTVIQDVPGTDNQASADYSNGRLDIYKLYLGQLDWKGHEAVGITDKNGKAIDHAHNVFLQVAYDFGIGAGIAFLAFFVFAGIRSIYYYLCHKGEETAMIPFGVLGVFGLCGLVEWVYLPYIPTGFAFYLVLILMVPAEVKKRKQEEQA